MLRYETLSNAYMYSTDANSLKKFVSVHTVENCRTHPIELSLNQFLLQMD